MKLFYSSIALLAFGSLLGPSIAMSAEARVVAEEPDGGVVVRGASSITVNPGDLLREGDVIRSNGATLVVSICDGALMTIYPESEVVLSSLQNEGAVLNLTKGEILGDTISGCAVSIANKAGKADISNGVYGVLMNQTGEGWILQIRNLDGNVSFTGSPGLDTSNATASVVESGQVTVVPAGEEVVIRGYYDENSGVFSLFASGAVRSDLPNEALDNMSSGAKQLEALRTGSDEPGADETPESVPYIEVPFADIEAASDKG